MDKKLGGFYDDGILAITKSSTGNFFIAGYYSGNINIDQTELPYWGDEDFFVAKMDK